MTLFHRYVRDVSRVSNQSSVEIDFEFGIY